MRSFENIAKLIRTRRVQHPKGYSQSELSHLLGYKNGQFISNVERALCNIPLKMLKRVSDVLDIPTLELKDAILRDQELTLDQYLSGSHDQKGVGKGVRGGEGKYEDSSIVVNTESPLRIISRDEATGKKAWEKRPEKGSYDKGNSQD